MKQTFRWLEQKTLDIKLLTLTFLSLLASVSYPAFSAQDTTDYVEWLASYTGEAAANTDGGKREGSAYAGQLFLGAEIDLEKFVGWANTKVHVAFTNRHGQNLAATHIGSSTSVQEIYGGQNSRLARLTVEKSFFDNQLQVEVGRTVANISFLGSELCQYFQTNSACGNPTFVFKTSNFTWWPVSSWGGHAKYWLSPEIYFHTGVYEENTPHQDLSDHGFDWSTDESTGVVVPVKLGYQTTWETDDYPRRYEIGGWYDGADYTDPAKDENGDFAAVTGNDYATQNGRSGIFARFEQTILRPSLNSKRSVTIFGAVLAGISGELIEDEYIKAGFVKRGTFTGRDEDTIGFVVTQQFYNDDAIEDQRILREANGGSGRPESSQTMMELSYGIHINDNIRIQPNVHYIINPDQFGERDRLQSLGDVWVVGVRFDVNLAGLLLR